MNTLTNDWATKLEPEFSKPYYLKLADFVEQQYQTQVVYPAVDHIFNAFQYTPYAKARVVILGQDPYHGAGQSHGLCFSVLPGTKPPPSLINIYKELNHDLGCTIPRHGGLIHWAEQGVLLLNTVLTVRDKEPGSHRGKGWETFTDQVIRLLDAKQESLVFMLWGSHAQQKEKLIQSNRHFIIRSPHPSPLSSYRGFFGSRPFSQANQFLLKSGQKEINWQL